MSPSRGPTAAAPGPSLDAAPQAGPGRGSRQQAPRWHTGTFPSARWLVAIGTVGLLYFLAGKLGLSLASVNASVSPIWPSTGIAIAAFLLFGRRIWPAIFLAAFLYNLTTAGTAWTSLAIAAGNTAEGFLGAWLTQRFAGGRQAFGNARGVLTFAAAAMLAASVSALAGVTSLAWAGFAAWSDARSLLLTWWAGNALGAIVVAPLVVLWADKPRVRLRLAAWGEGLFLVFIAAVALFWVYDGRAPTPLAIALVLLWPALRFGPRGTATLAAGISVVSVIATLAGRGPFQQPSLNDTLLLLQATLAAATLFALVVAGIAEERRQADARTRQAQLQRAAAELEEARRMSEFKTQFINIASHELKTPLLPIKAMIFLLRQRGQSMAPEAYDQSLGILERNFDRISLLVRDLLDAGRLQADRVALHRRPTDLAQVAREAVDSFQEAAKAAGVSLQVRTDGPVVVEADTARVSQVVYNLLSNAVKCTPPGGRVDVEAVHAGPSAVVSVHDTGVGLEPEQLAQLFEPFTQVHAGDTPEAKGTGLGLYISQGLVQRHGGRIWCESRGRGLGTTVSFSLPGQDSATSGPARRPAAAAAGAGAGTAAGMDDAAGA